VSDTSVEKYIDITLAVVVVYISRYNSGAEKQKKMLTKQIGYVNINKLSPRQAIAANTKRVP
jgi:hypothetical protein